MKEEGESENSYTMMIIIFIILAAIWIFLLRAGSYEIRTAVVNGQNMTTIETTGVQPYILKRGWVEVIFVAMLYCTALFPVWMSRYWMAHVVVNGASGSYDPSLDPQPVVDYYIVKKAGKSYRVKFIWLVYGLGSSRFPVPMRGKLETLIVPMVQMDTRSKNHYGSTHVHLIPFLKLPRPLYEFLNLNRDSYNIERIKIGYHNINFRPKDDDDADKDLMIEQLNEQVNKKSKLLARDFDDLEKVKRTSDILNPQPTFTDKITGMFKRSPQADNQQQQ